MAAILEVLPLLDKQAVSLQAVRLFHIPCSQEMQKYRNPADSTRLLRCACGFEIVFPAHGVAERVVTEAAIGEQCGVLPVGSFTSEHRGAIEVRVKAAG